MANTAAEAAANPGDGRDEGGEARGSGTRELRMLRLDEGLPLPRRSHDIDAGIDLYSAEDVEIAPGHRHLTGTGVAVGIPAGYVGLVHPRSGLAHKVGLSMVNAPGTVDAGYTGELRINLLNTDPEETIHIARGDRIAQLLVQQVELWPVREVADVAELGESERGDKGFGSTGGHVRL